MKIVNQIVSILLIANSASGRLTRTTTGNQKRELTADPGDHSCGDSEEWVTCRSSTCFDKTCALILNPDLEKKRPCTRDCKSGCACKSGYVRDSDGLCYEEDTCFSSYYEK
mmetsp:Transcript_2034/g.3098  ORF Transcript_2034/g.3098 Transcript_2034/m.3098 type:complete len:111 (-) Transcript_2034:283-615(-)